MVHPMFRALQEQEYKDDPYGWIITKDHIASEGEPNAVNTIGPSYIDPEIEKMLREGKGRAFRMYDDDGELYYEGHIIVKTDIKDMSTDAMSEAYFGPLNDFGEPNAGCTSIKYKMRSKNYAWEVL